MVAAAVCVVLMLAGALVVRTWVVQPFRVPSASMAPTLRSGEVILADRTTAGAARRGEVVVFDGEGYFGGPDSHGRYWVKRVVALGGDRISCCGQDGRLRLNGRPLPEPYLPAGMAPSAVRFDVIVPEGRMFLLGDSRADSTDSRFLLGAPGGGMVPVERVVGQADRVVWPLQSARRIDAGTEG